MRIFSTFLALLSILLISCSDESPSGTDDPNDTTDVVDTITNGVRMTVNGASWTAATTTFSDPFIGGGVILKEITARRGAAGTSEEITIGLESLDPGTYAVKTDGTGTTINYVADSDPGSSFSADPVEVASGSVTIVTNTSERLTGRYSFTGTSQTGTAITVSGGSFGIDK